MKLISTEISETTVQLTYTDGPSVLEASTVLIVRAPLEENSPAKTLNWNRLRVLSRVSDEIEAERQRLMDEVRKHQ